MNRSLFESLESRRLFAIITHYDLQNGVENTEGAMVTATYEKIGTGGSEVLAAGDLADTDFNAGDYLKITFGGVDPGAMQVVIV